MVAVIKKNSYLCIVMTNTYGNMAKLIGRQREIKELNACLNSDRSEFVIVYGRRRIGKTFLVNQLYQGKFDFMYTGGHHLTQKEQLQRFADAVRQFTKSTYPPKFDNWFQAFGSLQDYLSSLPKKQKKVIFFDEMPWIDTHASHFVKALEYFWNAWAAQRDDIFLIASGSATSWMTDKLLKNQGGLHGRITKQIYLEPFTLNEVELYLESRKCSWDRLQILQAYMILGGVPFYWSLLDTTQSLPQNVDNLFFTKNGLLHIEFDELYNTLFTPSEKYICIVKALAEKREGMTREEISRKTQLQGNTLTRILSNLEKCDFISDFAQFGNKTKNTIYRLQDFYTMFYFHFVEDNHTKDKEWWSHNINHPTINTWQGYTFENVCLSHLSQIKSALGISGITTSSNSWRCPTAQIDLVIDRADHLINLCEMKFCSTGTYEITKEYAEKIRSKTSDFISSTRTRKGIVSTFITTYGVRQGKNSVVAQKEITMEDLFRETKQS